MSLDFDPALRNRYVISGIGQFPRSRDTDRSVLGMAVTAANQALDDAMVERSEVDCILGYQESDSCSPEALASQLGIAQCAAYELLSGGASTETLVSMAIGHLESTNSRAVLIFRSMRGRSGKRMGGGAGWTSSSWAELLTGGAYLVPHGIFNAGQRVAILAARHLHEAGLEEDVLAGICTTFYEYAQTNPSAVMHGRPLTADAYRASPYLASPLRLHDYCVETDEANAIVITRAVDARARGARSAAIRAVIPKVAVAPAFQFNAEDPVRIAGEACGRILFQSAGLGPGDVDVAALYDCFSWVVLRQLTAYGLVAEPELGEFISSGQMSRSGALPTNTAGGMLSEGYTHGLNNVIELVRQVRRDHEDSVRQVPRSEVGLATGWAGPSVASGMILEAV